MNYKVEYITRLFQKTSSKAIESYCLSRLWHRLDNDEIKIVPQQYVNRHTDKYALTDVYLPQFKIHELQTKECINLGYVKKITNSDNNISFNPLNNFFNLFKKTN